MIDTWKMVRGARFWWYNRWHWLPHKSNLCLPDIHRVEITREVDDGWKAQLAGVDTLHDFWVDPASLYETLADVLPAYKSDRIAIERLAQERLRDCLFVLDYDVKQLELRVSAERSR